MFAEVLDSDSRPVLGALDPSVQALYPNRHSDQVTIRRADWRHILRGHPELLGKEDRIIRAITDPIEVRRDRDRPAERVVYYGILDGVSNKPIVKVAVVVRTNRSGMANTIRTAYPVSKDSFDEWLDDEEVIRIGE